MTEMKAHPDLKKGVDSCEGMEQMMRQSINEVLQAGW